MSIQPDWAAGLTSIGPGVYADGKGALHLDTEEMCKAAGYPPTAENQEMLAQVVREYWEMLRAELREAISPGPVDATAAAVFQYEPACKARPN